MILGVGPDAASWHSRRSGKSTLTLLPRLRGIDAGLATIWNDRGAALSLWRSVFEKRAPNSIGRVEELIAPKILGNGSSITDIPDELLQALTEAYREAAGARQAGAR